MPISLPYPRLLAAAALILATAVVVAIPSAASAKSDIRVVTASGETLAEHRQYSTKTVVKTDPSAECFGEDTGGTGQVFKSNDATAAGQLFDAARNVSALRPIGVSDFFSFGLAICEIGGVDPSPNGFWEIRVNHASAQVGGDQIELKKGDELLWFEVTDFSGPPVPELSLSADPRTTSATMEVTVHEYAPNGDKSPAAGAAVNGAALPTNAAGKTTVAIPNGTTNLRAARTGAIPSSAQSVCRAAKLSACAPAHDKTIYGTRKGERVADTKGNNTIRTGNGGDRVFLLKGGSDRVFCGKGKRDVVFVQKGDNDDRIARSCEKIKTV